MAQLPHSRGAKRRENKLLMGRKPSRYFRKFGNGWTKIERQRSKNSLQGIAKIRPAKYGIQELAGRKHFFEFDHQ